MDTDPCAYSAPHALSHAHHTHAGFLLGSPPDTAYRLQPPSAPAQFGYLLSPPVFPAAPPPYPIHKTPWPVPPSPSDISSSMAVSISLSSRTSSPSDDPPHNSPARPRPPDVKKKIHPCWMCHKSFDRPSTLKKHLLVHTGEKAFACESCGRRFGVASNLNRHAKTCQAKSNTHRATNSADTSTSSSSSAPPPSSPSRSPGEPATAAQLAPAPSPSPIPHRQSRKRKAPDSGEEPTTAPAHAPEQPPRPPRSRKRARRAPSPTLWIPDSLRAFDLTPMTKGTPVPLPPVRPFQDTNTYYLEERDSFDENAPQNPYHPRGWTGRLPGPGLLGNNVANRSGGQLLIFS